MSQTAKSVVTGILVKNSQEEFLLVKKTGKKGPYTGMYLPPGGAIEDGERIDDAALRELYEETGIKVNNLKRVYFNDDITENWEGVKRHFIGLLYTADYSSGEIAQQDGNDDTFDEVAWFSLQQLSTMPLSPPVKDLMRTYGHNL